MFLLGFDQSTNHRDRDHEHRGRLSDTQLHWSVTDDVIVISRMQMSNVLDFTENTLQLTVAVPGHLQVGGGGLQLLKSLNPCVLQLRTLNPVVLQQVVVQSGAPGGRKDPVRTPLEAHGAP